MAKVYRAVGGHKITQYIAELPEVQLEIDKATLEIGSTAEGILAGHHFEWDAFIEVAKGDIDGYVILNDERGQKAAMSIEYGRKPNAEGKGGMEGLQILHKAAHLRKKGR